MPAGQPGPGPFAVKGRVAEDLLGRRYGRLLVTSRAPNVGGKPAWQCHCDCGASKTVRAVCLKRGSARSCGCLARELTAARSTRHGMTGSPEWTSWQAMHARCSDPKKFSVYGSVEICDRWRSFENFLADMGKRPATDYSIDRIDSSRGYEPGNCRWATKTVQSENRRTTVWIEANGSRLTASEWARRTGMSLSAILSRLARGMSHQDVVTIPYRAATRKRLSHG